MNILFDQHQTRTSSTVLSRAPAPLTLNPKTSHPAPAGQKLPIPHLPLNTEGGGGITLNPKTLIPKTLKPKTLNPKP